MDDNESINRKKALGDQLANVNSVVVMKVLKSKHHKS